MEPNVFISYNWGSEKLADKIEQCLKQIANINRDKTGIKPWDSINDFMRSIRDNDLIVIIISDVYLKSEACMYEVLQLIKDDNWINRSMFIVEESAKSIYRTTGQLEYIEFWDKEFEKLKNKLEGIDRTSTIYQTAQLKKMALIKLHINDFLSIVAERNNPEIDQAIQAIEERIQSYTKEGNQDEGVLLNKVYKGLDPWGDDLEVEILRHNNDHIVCYWKNHLSEPNIIVDKVMNLIVDEHGKCMYNLNLKIPSENDLKKYFQYMYSGTMHFDSSKLTITFNNGQCMTYLFGGAGSEDYEFSGAYRMGADLSTVLTLEC